MKEILFAAAVGAGFIFTQNASADVLFSDGFNYTAPGTLGGKVNPGSGYTWGSGNSGMTIANANLTYPGLQDLGGNELSIAWGSSGSITNGYANVTSGQIYYSFLLDVTTYSGGNNYLTALNPGTTTPGGSGDAINAYMYSNGDIGLRTAGKSTATYSTALSLNTTYLVVLEYDFSTTNASLYLDPTPGDSQPTPTVSIAGSGTVTSIDNLGFKSQSATGDFLIDNVIIGTSWADVTPLAVTPEPSTLALVGLGALGLGALRRMRR